MHAIDNYAQIKDDMTIFEAPFNEFYNYKIKTNIDAYIHKHA
jgi:hypothetical protein